MELGAIVCKPRNPLCPTCPVRTWCLAYQSDRISEFPRKLKKQATPQYPIAVGCCIQKQPGFNYPPQTRRVAGRVVGISRRKNQKREKAEAACIREIKEEVNLTVKVDSHLCRVKHAYTHFKIQMDVFCCSYISGRVKLNGPVDHRWIRLNQLDDYPLPKANHKFLANLIQYASQRA